MQDAGNAPRQYYRVFLYDPDGSVSMVREVEASSDEEASRLALVLLHQHPLRVSAEVRQGVRHVRRHIA